jgi:CHAD domain-containing protein
MVIRTPASLIDRHLTELAAIVPAVRTADVDAVHRARVSTRRLREVAPFAADDIAKAGKSQARDVGRALGDVRELDVADAMLERLQVRARFANDLIGDLRRAVASEQRSARRAMVKVVEAFDPASLRERAGRAQRVNGRFDRSWIPALRERIRERADAALAALRRADAFYMPGRSHAARIAIKKLRYATEIAVETGLWQPRKLQRDLHRSQELLGDIHDTQVLVERVRRHRADSESHTREADWLLDLLHADIESWHARFLERVPRLHDAAGACAQWAVRGQRSWRRRFAGVFPLVAASAVVVPPLLDALGERAQRDGEPRLRQFALRPAERS